MVYLLEKYEYEYKSKLTGYESWEGQIIYIKKIAQWADEFSTDAFGGNACNNL